MQLTCIRLATRVRYNIISPLILLECEKRPWKTPLLRICRLFGNDRRWGRIGSALGKITYSRYSDANYKV